MVLPLPTKNFMNHFCESPYSSVFLSIILCLYTDNQVIENGLIYRGEIHQMNHPKI